MGSFGVIPEEFDVKLDFVVELYGQMAKLLIASVEMAKLDAQGNLEVQLPLQGTADLSDGRRMAICLSR